MTKTVRSRKKSIAQRIGTPGKIGYSGGKLSPKEKDLIRGIVAAKSLQAFEAIFKSPPTTPNVLNIKITEKQKNAVKTKVSSRFRLTTSNNFFIF